MLEKLPQQLTPLLWHCLDPVVAPFALVIEVALVALEIFNELFNAIPLKELAARVKTTLPEDLKEIIEKIGAFSNEQLLKSFLTATPEEIQFIREIVNEFEVNNHQMCHILWGAFVHLQDDAKKHAQWEENFKNKRIRTYSSSHGSDGEQYAITTHIFSELLWGRNTLNGESFTWFQAERHKAGLGYHIRHLFDFILYCKSGENQGPWGHSPFTEKDPMILRKRVRPLAHPLRVL